MGFFKDILSIFHKYDMDLIKKVKENEEVYSFQFDAKDVKAWKPGQHGIFFIKHKKIHKSIRPFSLASTKEEKIVMISTKINNNPSEFKQALLTMETGVPIRMRGPLGPLYIRENKPTLLIAGGIGITPHRAILLDLTNHKESHEPVILLYIDSQNNHIYKDELKDFNKTDFIDIKLLDDRQIFTDEINDFINQYKDDGRFFLSGKKNMVKDIKKYLKKHKVKGKYIYKDIFYGY